MQDNQPVNLTYGQMSDMVDRIEQIPPLKGEGAPTSDTPAFHLGQTYLDTTTGDMYYCSGAVSESGSLPEYTWEPVAGDAPEYVAGDNITITEESGVYVISADGGSAPTVVQTTGTSTTDVMSQKAVTDTLFAKNNNTLIWIGQDNYQNKQSCNSPSGLVLGSGLMALNNDAFDFITVSFAGNPQPVRYAINLMGNSPLAIGGISIGKYSHAKGQSSVALGTGVATKVTTANSGNSVAVGASAYADGTYSVALGAGAYANGTGVMDVGTSRVSNTAGYNSSAYRLLTGLYDPQSDHDAATKGYVDPTTDSAAPTTATVGRLGQIQIDTSTATAYMCVAADTATPSYTWKQITA